MEETSSARFKTGKLSSSKPTSKSCPFISKNLTSPYSPSNLTPGGYIEFQESDITGVFSEDDTFKGTAFERYQNIVKTASLKINRRLDIAPELASLVREAGFVDVVETKIRWPFGVWPKRKDYKELGIMGKVILESGLEAYGLALMTRVLGMEAGEVKALCEEVKGNLKDRGVHCQEWQYVVVGRKPE